MKEQEIYDLLKDQQDILVHISQRLYQMEESKTLQKDYGGDFDRIRSELELLRNYVKITDAKEMAKNYATSSSNLLSAIREQNATHSELIKEIPSKIKVGVQHSFSDKQRPYIIFGICLLFAFFFAVIVSVKLWRFNSDLGESDIKIRMVRLMYPTMWVDVDTIYNNSPKSSKKWVKEEEERLMAIKKAEELARKSNAEAGQAEAEVRRLKDNKK